MPRPSEQNALRIVLHEPPRRIHCFEKRLMSPGPKVAVVDDDESVRESLPDLLRELGYTARAFASAEEFLTSHSISETQCLILDVAMPHISGPELYRELNLRGYTIPVIFITAVADRSLPRALVRRGAVACLAKPFSEQDLREALAAALPEA